MHKTSSPCACPKDVTYYQKIYRPKLLRHLFKYGLMFLIYYTYMSLIHKMIINCLVFYCYNSMFCPKKGAFFVQDKCFEIKWNFTSFVNWIIIFFYFILHIQIVFAPDHLVIVVFQFVQLCKNKYKQHVFIIKWR